MKKEKGITLIALIVSIIVMLILVVVTINIVFEGGLIDKAQQAKDDTELAAQNDNNMINEAGDRITEAVGNENIVEAWDGSMTEVVEKNEIYEITNAKELAWIANQVNSGINLFTGKTVKLMNNINFGATWDDNGNKTGGINWTPIGNIESGDFTTGFKGTFDGNNKIIKKMYVNTIDIQRHAGLFGVAGLGAIIKDVNIESSYIKGTESGAIIGAGLNLTVNGCNSSSIIYGTQFAGGIIGSAAGEVTINNCINSSIVYGTRFAGGICGYSDQDNNLGAQSENIINNCTNSGKINSEGDAGGICAYHNAHDINSKIKYCNNSGKIETIDGYVAGICGYCSLGNMLNVDDIIINCTNSGTITGEKKNSIVNWN